MRFSFILHSLSHRTSFPQLDCFSIGGGCQRINFRVLSNSGTQEDRILGIVHNNAFESEYRAYDSQRCWEWAATTVAMISMIEPNTFSYYTSMLRSWRSSCHIRHRSCGNLYPSVIRSETTKTFGFKQSLIYILFNVPIFRRSLTYILSIFTI